jgi:hypothetical protein
VGASGYERAVGRDHEERVQLRGWPRLEEPTDVLRRGPRTDYAGVLWSTHRNVVLLWGNQHDVGDGRHLNRRHDSGTPSALVDESNSATASRHAQHFLNLGFGLEEVRERRRTEKHRQPSGGGPPLPPSKRRKQSEGSVHPGWVSPFAQYRTQHVPVLTAEGSTSSRVAVPREDLVERERKLGADALEVAHPVSVDTIDGDYKQ